MKRKQKLTRLMKLKKNVRRHFKLALVPHGANQYRPHLVRRYGLTALLVLVIGMQALYNVSTAGSVLGAKTSVTGQQLLADANVQRAAYRLPPLKINAELSKAARLKADDMFAGQYWAHTSPSGTTPWHWFAAAGYDYTAAGENLAKNFATSDAVTAAWMASPAHRDNILNSRYSDVGFAVVDGTLQGKPATLVVALYGQQATSAVAAANTRATAAPNETLSPMARFGVALESLTPAAFASLFLVLIAAAVAMTAHFYRQKLPKKRRESWYRHHGLIKAGGMLSLVIVALFLYGGGQI